MTVKRSLPILKRVEFTNFSLYQNQRTLSVDICDGVFCLAGANGLGKSTFLACVNYALTGVVAEPDRKFDSLREYYKSSLDYAAQYFDGRVAEDDRSSASVAVEFTVGRSRYKLRRNFFDPKSLQYLEVRRSDGELMLETEGLAGDQLHRAYQEQLIRDCDLTSFEQFVFLQHFLTTFDERRHLLFWDEKVVVPALYLAFGLNAADADASDELRRKIERADSLARNAQWQATVARRRLLALGGEDVAEADLTELQAEHRSLQERSREALDQFAAARRVYDDAELVVAELSARQTKLRLLYDEAFSKRVQAHHDARLHPVIQDILQSGQCSICGESGPHVTVTVEQRLAEKVCPLCTTRERTFTDAESMSELERLDSELAAAQAELSSAQQRAKRLRSQSEVGAQAAESAVEALSDFEARNSEVMAVITSPTSTLAAQRAALQAEISDAKQRRDRERQRRDSLREQLQPYQERLAAAYEDGERDFVPLFRRLAKSFIGLDLDVFLVPKRPIGFSVALEVQGTRRNSTNQLSESQRFFLDIALRMALIQHMTKATGACLFVDTPEGSLDVSYEKRAGKMFAEFVHDGYQIVMTANINASQLLVELADQCNGEKMQLIRMTEWTPLSEVQAEAEDLFDLAYLRIERKLGVAP